ncbi:uncharacterized protein LOC131255901 [Magnolia sinica]|uniref:uncharacterized protein LOC131255901 n=1 Tax=Magnolia sinica TaxID=86752 RepID=UPI002658461F|nr:uncharacterized protein LOC131255901 [Magnolia sinica]
MKAAAKVIFLCRDSDGFGPAIYDALQPNPNSSLQRTESSFDLSLERYGITDAKASGEIVNFIDSQGLSQVSIVLLQNYEPPVAAYAVNGVLASIIGENSSDLPTIVLPLIVAAQKLRREMTNLTQADRKITVYGAQIGPKTDFTEAVVSGIQEAPPSLQVACETLACLLELVCVLGLPTAVLVGSSGQRQAEGTTDQELEALYELGEFLAGKLGLCFSRDRIHWNLKEKSKGTQEPWRALYG